MANFNPVRVALANLNSTPIVDGQLLFVTDQDNGKNNIYIDVGSVRKQVGLFDWSVILNKPFNTIGSGLVVTDGVLEGETRWDMITDKPFETVGDGLKVEGNALKSDVAWNDVTNKPFNTIGAGLSVVNNALTANAQPWGTISNKPFNSIGAGLTVDSNGVLIAIGGGTGVDWSTEINNKPFETIGSGLQVINGALETDITLGWTHVTNKPFDTIGSGLSVNSNRELFTQYAWGDVTSKPFATIGNGLNVDVNNVLNTDIQTISVPINGTASQYNVCEQTLTINAGMTSEVNTEINGTKYMQYTKNLSVSADNEFRFESDELLATSLIDVYTSKQSMSPKSIVIDTTNSPHTCTLTFPKSDVAENMTCRIYIR